MSISFARPDIAQLKFQLYGRSVHPELFQIHAEADVWHQTFLAVIRVCDAGHTVELRTSDETVTEVMATRNQLLPQQNRLVNRRLRGHHDESVEFRSGLSYQASFHLEELDPDVFLDFNEELIVDSGQAKVAYHFPSMNRLSPGPLSVIRAESTSDSLLVHAYHTFPESCAVVKTQSLFEL